MAGAVRETVGTTIGEAGSSCTNFSPCNKSGGLAGEDTGPSSDIERLGDAEFNAEIVTLIPQLRAFARSLCGHREFADDLTQETMLRAWGARQRFRPGTNLRAWLFVILRNNFLSQMRRTRFAGEWDESAAARELSMPPSQEHHLHVGDLQRALLRLPETQREALILVAAGGFSYEEAAQICRCAVGTIKSRVSRARTTLERMFASGACPSRAESRVQKDGAAEAVMNEVDRIVGSQNRFGAGSVERTAVAVGVGNGAVEEPRRGTLGLTE